MTTVLIADYDTDIREVVRMLLDEEGYACLEAGDGETTLRLLRESAEPMIVLLEHFPTGMNSADVLRAVAEDSTFARHTFVFLSTSADHLPPELSLLVLSLCLPVVGKPFDIDVLLAAVRAAEKKLAASEAAVHNTVSVSVVRHRESGFVYGRI